MDSPRLKAKTEPGFARTHPLFGTMAVLATKHDKVALFEPAFMSELGMRIERADIDTDAFGTFAGEIPREGTAFETVVRKARAGAESAGSRFGLASEGSIGASPTLPFVNANVELAAFVDLESDNTVVEHFVSHSIKTVCIRVGQDDDPSHRLAVGGFPEHGVIVRPASTKSGPIHKGLHSLDAVRECIRFDVDGRASIESDFRANHCPSRRPAISAAAAALARRLREACGDCGAPGWGPIEKVTKLQCRTCGHQVARSNRSTFGCAVCGTTEETVNPNSTEILEPEWCAICNP